MHACQHAVLRLHYTQVRFGPFIPIEVWSENTLAQHYLYFADHKGRYIRLAYADAVTGPWKIHVPGTLRIEDSYFLTSQPEVSAEQRGQYEDAGRL